MTYATLMVHLEPERPNDARLEVAGELAEQFGAKLIGIAAWEYAQDPYFAEGDFAQIFIEEDQAKLKERLTGMEEEFRRAVHKRVRDIEWRCALDMPTRYVLREARAADLVITGPNRDGPLPNPLRRLDPSDLVMQAGRPILVVPPETEWLRLKTVLVGWKDTREARRAVCDALPLLRKAKEVHVVEILEGDGSAAAARARVNDVVAWLGRHGIDAIGTVPTAVGDAARQLDTVALETGASLIVAGAYGHSRLREWVSGGVTREFLSRSKHCSLLAH